MVRRSSRPAPSPELRDRVLSAVLSAPAPMTWSDRIWFSRAWRLAAVAAALAVVVLEQMAGAPLRSVRVTPAPQPQVVLSVEVLLDELLQEGGEG